MSKVNKKIKKLHKEFVKRNGNEPKFADVVVKADDDEFSTLIKLRDYDPNNTENDPDDGSVIFYADGVNGLCEIDSDFEIVDINGFCDTY